MRLLDLSIRNFMRFRKAHVRIANAGMTLIEGVNHDDESATSNGAGKSSIVDALVWCLYGVTTHEPSAQGDDVVNEKRDKNCEVRVTFVVKKTKWEVTRRRAWKKGGKTVQLVLVKYEKNGDGYDHSKGTHRDTQSAIEKLIGMSVATFRHACVFGQGRAYRFSRLTDTEKKGVLDEMLGSEIYALAGQKAADQLAQAERDLDKAKNALENASESLQDARERLAKVKAKEADRARLEQKARKQLKRELADVRKQRGKLDDDKLKGIQSEMLKAESEATSAQESWRKAMNAADSSRVALKQLEAKRAKVRSQQHTDCVTCGQPIDSKHIEKQLAAIDEEIEKQSKIDFDAEEALKKAKKWKDLTSEAAKRLEGENDKLSTERYRLDERYETLKERIARVEEIGDYAELIADERERVAKLKKKLRKLKAFVTERKEQVEQLRFWHRGFSAKGLRSLMLDSCLPFLNARLDAYTNALTAGNIQVEFRTQRQLKGGGMREDFHVDVRNKHGSTKYAMNSIGERAKIDIIVGLALQDMAASRSNVPVNVAFFDEVFDGLDDRGIDRAVQVLSQLKRESAFIISHKSELKTFFSKRIVVVKKNGESRIETN